MLSPEELAFPVLKVAKSILQNQMTTLGTCTRRTATQIYPETSAPARSPGSAARCVGDQGMDRSSDPPSSADERAQPCRASRALRQCCPTSHKSQHLSTDLYHPLSL